MIKKLTLIVALVPAILLTACKKDKTENNGQFYVNATKNNTSWRAVEMEASKPAASDTISIIARAVPAGTKLPEETFRLVIPNFRPGTYQAERQNTFFWNTVGLDVITAEYKLIDKLSSPVTITEYNSSAKTIKGTFYVSLTKTHPTTVATEKIELTEGTFYVQIKEY